MIRIIKRYESRKLYDTEESRYVSLEDLAAWVREGQEVKVIDNATSEDVTPQILTQVILDGGKRGTSFLPTDLLHELVRAGERAFQSGVEQVQTKVDHIVKRSIDRLAPVRQAREEMSVLRDRLAELELTLVKLEEDNVKNAPPARKRTTKTTAKKVARTTAPKKTAKRATKTAAKKTVAKKATARKAAAKKTVAKKTAAKKATSTKTAAAPKKRTTAIAKKRTTAMTKTGSNAAGATIN